MTTRQDEHQALTTEWLYEHTILCFELKDASRAAIDAWFEAVKSHFAAWPTSKPYAVIHDFSAINSTGYLRQRSEELGALASEALRGSSAIVLKNSLSLQISRLFVRINTQWKVARQIFTDREDAIAWLLRTVAATPTTAP
jgi:hypothetical protein